MKKEKCICGREHRASVKEVIIEKGAIKKLPECIRRYNAKKVFILSDVNTYAAAGSLVCENLESDNISYSKYVFNSTSLEPDENAVGSAVMNYDYECDLVIGVGSGVINDIGKIIAKTTNNPYIIVSTAPSMDGYASATSSMSIDGLKVSVPSKCADIIIGDIDILKNAPREMLCAGLGDMLAKYISICEWRIGNLITGEYYCENIASLVRNALEKCVCNADGLLKRDENAVKAVFEGLVIGGMAMEYAGLSRPASGIEHYLSHVWDMRGLEKGTSVDLHGIQCAIGSLIAIRLYEQIKEIKPDKEKATRYAEKFDFNKWGAKLKEFIGKGADAMIAQEEKEKKYNTEMHKGRLKIIMDNWDEILKIINEELPSAHELENILDKIGAPKTPGEIGIDAETVEMTFKASKDIRYKYVLSHLAWDLGIIDEMVY